MISVRVHHLASPLGAGILRATLYEDSCAWENCHDLYGLGMLSWAASELPKHFVADPDAPTILDCRCPDWQDWARSGHSTVICLCDRHLRYPLPPTAYRRGASRKSGERCFPAFPHRWPEMLSRKWEPAIRPWKPVPSIGFCGVAHRPQTRSKAVAVLEQTSRLESRIVSRVRFMGQDAGSRVRARREFMDVLQNTDYQLCVRGVGNWDYRLYETLCAGRIPVLVDTDRSLPAKLDWAQYAVIVPEKQVRRLVDHVLRWHARNRTRWEEIQLANRNMWMEQLSPVGWWRSFAKERMAS